MSAADLLGQLIALGITVQVKGGFLSLRGHGPKLDEALLNDIRRRKSEFVALLNGRTCRWCLKSIWWRGTTAVALADGTSLHGECREAFNLARITRSAEAAMHSAPAVDPGEVMLRGELASIEQEL